MMRKFLKYLFTCFLAVAVFFSALEQPLKADMFGADVVVLGKILAEAIEQLAALEQIIGTTRDTVSLLEEMNRGIKEVLRLAETAHIPLPKQVYDDAKTIDQAVATAEKVYGTISKNAPIFQKDHYQSGTEGLFISEDAFEYSTFLDKNGEQVKRSAIAANQTAATKLTAETLGVLLHAVSHTNRILAKDLEITSTNRLEQTAKDNAQFETFIQTHDFLENDFSTQQMAPLNSFNATSSGGGQ